MDRTACTEPHSLYKGAVYLTFTAEIEFICDNVAELGLCSVSKSCKTCYKQINKSDKVGAMEAQTDVNTFS